MDSKTNRQQLEQAIAVQESLRGSVDDAIIDATIATLKKELAALEPVPQQRKQVTVLFMDIAGSTEIIQQLDPEENLIIMDTALKRLSIPVEQNGGHVTRYMGDGFQAIFGTPVARENDPEMAVRAGLGILAAAEEYAGEVADKWGIQSFKVRVGINTGLAVIGGQSEAEDTISGTVVNLAARLESAAEPGTVLISHDTYKHVRGIFDFELLEPIQAKGFPDPVQVYRVLRAKPRPFYRGMRGVEGVETRMVGREVEFLQLQKILQEVIEEGERAMVTVIGEAGLGKSRLLYEFENWVDLLPEDIRLVKGRARLETRHLPYGLLRDLFASRFQITDDDRAEVVREKLGSGFQEELGAGKQNEMKSHVIGQLLGYDFSKSHHLESVAKDPQQLRNRAFLYLVDFFVGVSGQGPFLILLEDLHWADDSSLDALNHLAQELSMNPVLIVGTARHTFFERRPNWGEGQNFHRQILLEPLSKRDSRRLVAEVLQKVQDLPESLSEMVASNAEGNPFYVEELIKMLVDDGVFIRDEPHWRVKKEKLVEVHVPSTLTGVLQARLDGLPLEEKTVLQQASVVGRIFWDRVIERIREAANEGANISASLTSILDGLRGRELVYRRESSAFSDSREHMFKHALLREVTYESVLLRVRRIYHALVAEWLIEQGGEQEGLIADHFERAGKVPEALSYLKKAGDAAAAAYANEEAIDYYSRALALVPEVGLEPETRFDLLLARESVFDLQGNRESQWQDLEALGSIAEALNDDTKRSYVWIRRANLAYETGEYRDAIVSAKQAISLSKADTLYEIGLTAKAHNLWSRAHWHMGDLGPSQRPAEVALTYARKARDRKEEILALNNLGWINFYAGRFANAEEYFEMILSLARETGNRLMQGLGKHNMAFLSASLGDYNMAEIYFDQAVAIHREIGNRRNEYMSVAFIGFVMVAKEEYPRAKAYLEKSRKVLHEIGDPIYEALAHHFLGHIHFQRGEIDEAETNYKIALDISISTNQPREIATMVRGMLAQVALASGSLQLAMRYVEDILTDFRESRQRYILWEGLRVYLNCHQVLQAANDPRAGDVLGTAYDLLQHFAANIPDERRQRMFLEKTPGSREILALWKARESKGEYK